MQLDRRLDETCLFFDVDGSLIDIAPHPDAVVVPPSLIDDLDRASGLVHGALALVSGRSIAQIDRLFGRNRFRASGVHGAEMRYEPDAPIVMADSDVIPAPVWDDLQGVVKAFPGTVVEDKRFSFAVHFRAVPEAGASLRLALVSLVERHPDSALRLMPGHYVYELKRTTFNKGEAIRRFLDNPRFKGRRPIFIGDDVTDQPGFEAAVAHDGLAYSVGKRLPGSTGMFESPSDVRHWVTQIARMESLHA